MNLTLLTQLATGGATASTATATKTGEYDEHHRAQARAEGRPTERMLTPGIFGAMKKDSAVDVALVWTDQSGSLSYFCARESRTPVRLTIAALDLALALPARDQNDPTARYSGLDTPRRLIVSDHQTLRRLMAWVKVAASSAPADDYEAASVHRRLTVASRLVASTRLIVLTRALTRKFWLGAQYDPEDFGAWRRAFGFGAGATTMSVMAGLVDLASEGRVHPEWARQAFAAESFALLSAGYPGLRSAVAAFGRVETADTATRAIMMTDPLLHERSLMDGSLSSLRILNVADKSFTAVVSTPFKLRAGKQILLIDPHSPDPGAWADTMLQGVTVARLGGQDQLIATIATASSRARSNLSTIIAGALASNGRNLLVAESPYLPFAKADSGAARWTAASATRMEADAAAGKPRRDIPLDVIVAGAPTI